MWTVDCITGKTGLELGYDYGYGYGYGFSETTF